MDKNEAVDVIVMLLDNLHFDGAISSFEYNKANEALRVLIQEGK